MPEDIQITMPARINVLGNPADAVEGDFAVISTAVRLYAHALIAPQAQITIEHYNSDPRSGGSLLAKLNQPRLPLADESTLRLQTAAFNRLARFSPELREKAADQGAAIRTWTEVPQGSGLGGSSLLVLLVLAGLRAFYGLDERQHNDYLLAEIAQRVEGRDLGITCGYADRYVPLFGGLLYIDYREKLQQREMGQEPLATVERLEDHVPGLPLVLASSGEAHDSGDVHSRLRALYLAELERAGNTRTIGPLETIMRQVYECAWRGKYDLLSGDLAAFGGRMRANHEAVNRLMRQCGFEAGAGAANNLLIASAYDLGAYGAKLTGAGDGGSVFALVEPGREAHFAERWLQAARRAGLENAWVLRPQISRRGVRIAAAGVD